MSTETHFTTRLPQKRMAADCLFVDEHDRVLLVEPTYKSTWDLPGGGVGSDESPRDAAAREVQEELGISVEPGALLAVDWLPRQGDFTEVVAFLFDGGVADGSFVGRCHLDPSEIRSARFVSLSEAVDLIDGETHLRVSAAFDARTTGVTAYLEDGRKL